MPRQHIQLSPRFGHGVLVLLFLAATVQSGLAGPPQPCSGRFLEMKPGQKHLQAAETGKLHPAGKDDTPCKCGAVQGPDLSRRHFAEVEVTLDEVVTLEDLAALPQAPGGEVRVLDGAKRAWAQLPATVVGDLIEKGADITVSRDFLLVGASQKMSSAGDILFTASEPCSGESVEGANTTNYPIPLGEWTRSNIGVSGAPAGAEVTCLDVHYEIVHPYVGNLVVDLANEAISLEYRLWARDGGSTDDISETVTGIRFFAGEKVNQTWGLWAMDQAPGDNGYIDKWWIKIYYIMCPEVPCSGDCATGSRETNYPIPYLEGWAHSDIAISGTPARAYVNCIDVHFEIRHPWISDLVVDVSNQTAWRMYRVWNREGGASQNINTTVRDIKVFTNERPDQIWKLSAQDRGWGDDGYIDSWWVKVYYQPDPVPVPQHDECLEALPVVDGVPYDSSTAGATGDDLTTCAFNDVNDVWHVYTPPHTGLTTLRIGCTNFDTTLSVFDQCGGVEIACNDNTCADTNSEMTLLTTGGLDYLVRVAGYGRHVGDYTLIVNQEPYILPDEPARPSPCDGAGGVDRDVILAWNDSAGLAVSVTSKAPGPPGAKKVTANKIIYGSDDRVDEYAITDPGILAAGDAAVLLLNWSDLAPWRNDGTFTLPTETFARDYEWQTDRALCPDEPFRDQPVTGWCSGVLVAPDLVATAGHCMTCETPSDVAVVFGFVMVDDLTAVATISAENVYRCAEVVGRQDGHPDWSLIRLERAVTNHTPLPLRRSGKVSDHQPLLVVGHPYGLPRKYDMGGTVRDNTPVTYFQANLDTYHASSGSPVVNLDTMVVEGLLVVGNPDFVWDPIAGCDRSNVCPDGGCPPNEEAGETAPSWETVTRATSFSGVVPAFDVYLGTDPGKLQLIDENTVVPWSTAAPLQQGTAYYWRVVAKNACGETAGPLWSFTTGSN